jgi:ADP-ribose pyrophosphatase YjhB (NUDIX family)
MSKKNGWQIPSGALESDESPIQGLARELCEELGKEFTYRPLGPVDVSSFLMDEKITLLSIGFLVQYLGGLIAPGDDMADAEVTWMSLEEIKFQKDISVPQNGSNFERALELFRLLKSSTPKRPNE